ncbi:unnamed protein product, partial [Staurois parvus]
MSCQSAPANSDYKCYTYQFSLAITLNMHYCYRILAGAGRKDT